MSDFKRPSSNNQGASPVDYILLDDGAFQETLIIRNLLIKHDVFLPLLNRMEEKEGKKERRVHVCKTIFQWPTLSSGVASG